MATIYRFVVENKTKASGGDGRGAKERTSKGASKKGKNLPLFGGSKGGVEHNRKMRAINPLLNKITYGGWEKGMRISRAMGGLVKVNTETGKLSLGGPAIAIIIAFVLQTAWSMINKWQTALRQKADRENTQNYKKLENGTSAIHGAYSASVDVWTGKITYNENK